MQKNDEIQVEVLDDGTIKTTVNGRVSAANHQNAEDFLRHMARLSGGSVSTNRIGHTHAHTHVHSHDKESA